MLCAEVVDYGVDALTFTATHDAPHLKDMRDYWMAIMSEDTNEIEKLRESGAQGYRGHRSKHLSFGERQDGWMFTVTGHPSQGVAEDGRQHWRDARCTRIDLQVTTRGGQRPSSYVSDLRSTVRRRESESGLLRRISTVTYEMAGGGDSVSFGSRRSGSFGRVYDKSSEQRGKVGPGLWRYEVEFKRLQARQMWRMYCSGVPSGILAVGVVAEWLERHHVPRDWELNAPRVKLPSSYRLRDEERRFDWLAVNVAPIVRAVDNPHLRRSLKSRMGF